MLICVLRTFRVENKADAQHMFGSAASECCGYCSIKRPGTDTRSRYQTPVRPLTLDDASHKVLQLNSSVEITSESDEDDAIVLNVKLFSKGNRVLLWNCMGFINIADYRFKPEHRHEINLPLFKQPTYVLTYGNDCDTLAAKNHPCDGILHVTLLFTNDVEHPSLANFLLCGVFLCPVTVPFDGSQGSAIVSADSPTSVTPAVLCSMTSSDPAGISAGTEIEGETSNRDSSERDANLRSYNGSMVSDALQTAPTDAELILNDMQRFFTNIFSPPSTPVPGPHSPQTDS